MHLARVALYGRKCAQYTFMSTPSEKPVRDFGSVLKACLGGQHMLRLVEPPSDEMDIAAHMKIIYPLTSTGPSLGARVVKNSASLLIVGFPCIVFAGALVQIRMGNKIVFGVARRCTPKGSEYEVEIEKQEIY
jgi:hypothetical protein